MSELRAGSRIVMRVDDRPQSRETAGERGVIRKMWPDGRCVVRLDSGKVLGCGVELLMPEEEWPWPPDPR